MSTHPKAFVIGHPIAQSRSPLIHGHWLKTLGLDGSYERIDVPSDQLKDFLDQVKAGAFVGGNVTIPHKETVMTCLDEVDETAARIGAVNTIYHHEGRLCGTNTDAMGFLASLDEQAPLWRSHVKHALVLGAGGAARAIVAGLKGQGIKVTLTNRSRDKAETLAKAFNAQVHSWGQKEAALETTDLLINTTALGMSGKPPLEISLESLPPHAIVNDIVYVPLETPLLRAARMHGLKAVDGLGMLLHQAVPGFARWFGTRPEVTPALRALVEADIQRQTA